MEQLDKTPLWDLAFLGHHVRDKNNTGVFNKEKMPEIYKIDVYQSFCQSLGGTTGFIVSKKGAEKFLDFLNKTGATNGIDTCIQKSANDFLAGFAGYLQADGYDGYNSICNLPDVTRVGCWAHIRRKFESAFKEGASAGKLLAEKFLIEIKKLFLVEREVIPLTVDERVKIRQEKSLPVINAIRKLIDDNINKIVPRSKLGSAFGYISNEWPHLEHFLNNGNISLSNNRVENAIRPFAIGRKNWLFSDTIEGAEASAAIYVRPQ